MRSPPDASTPGPRSTCSCGTRFTPRRVKVELWPVKRRDGVTASTIGTEGTLTGEGVGVGAEAPAVTLKVASEETSVSRPVNNREGWRRMAGACAATCTDKVAVLSFCTCTLPFMEMPGPKLTLMPL